jgi:uncharacterized protein with PIN domain
VAQRYAVTARAPLSRCLPCNGELKRRLPVAVRERVPPYTFDTQREFWECDGCGRVYWAGTHAERILTRLRACVPGAVGGPPSGPA